MPAKLPIWDQRMLILMDHCLSTELVASQKEFLISVGMIPTGIRQVRKGIQSFTLEHLFAAGRKYNINMNWFFGFDDKMSRGKNDLNPLLLLKEAVVAVELEIKRRR